MMDPLRVAFVGCGRFSGRAIYPSLAASGMELVAVCGRTRERTETRAAEYGVEQVFYDPVEMCTAVKPDAVLIVAGPQGHYDIASALIPLGLPIWMEKPCAVNSEQASELSARAGAAGLLVQVGFNYRYTRGIQKALDLTRMDESSTPAMVSVRWWLGEPDRRRLMQHYGCHAVDLLHYLTPGGLLDSEPPHVDYTRKGNHDYYLATFRGVEGCIAVLEFTSQMPLEGHWSRVDLHSSDGLISVREFSEVTHHKSGSRGDLAGPEEPAWNGDSIWPTGAAIAAGSFREVWGYLPELVRFREAAQGLRSPESTIHEAAWGMKVLDRLMAS